MLRSWLGRRAVKSPLKGNASPAGKPRRAGWAFAAATLATALTPLTTQAESPHGLPAGSIYVAMGSSFAAGPGVAQPAEAAPARCGRSADNYAHQLARKRNLRLVDVTCGGATTAHILGPWSELPPQLDAVTPEARLVTVTIGGNDVNYIGRLYMASCTAAHQAQQPGFCRALAGRAPPSGAGLAAAPSEQDWNKVEAGLEQVAREIRRRAPHARIVFVDYFTVLPEHHLCAQTPLDEGQAVGARETARRLAQLTAAVAAHTGAEDLHVSELSRGHDACSKTPWVTGFIPQSGSERFAPYHPNLAGMTAVANALDRKLGR